ncbi:substrate-binding domain-containing protein [Sphingomonas sp. SORGH_AS_0879]|uniref:substrate-binding domain-containing protein n=1 Tax=Sphingomonas sp. SORGH_AS_0879 TaxID=3041790 RepID=UPI0027861D78|nr:substrate-binding domain-containing protein [Sphingomonas sp. SORGH_AS_0879]MDQ1230926.1 phosphate transport system substrate-binding protein [Sphingomonas sp. SORGH_AS_0879]
MRLPCLLAAMFALAACHDQANGGGAGVREQITAVGSSTVYPFTTIIAERFVAADPEAKAPVIESTGTGAGMKLFCAGIGAGHPDIENASRRMKAGEYRDCAAHGAAEVLEIPIGIDGIAFAESKRGPRMALTTADIYRAIGAHPGGKPNRARTWRDVNPALPAIPIQVYGPPATSGTRDALAELILMRGCDAVEPQARALSVRDPEAHHLLCTRVRDDGAYIDAGENDNLIVQKLQANPDALGVFGYSYLEENRQTVNGVTIDGVAPTYDAIAADRYPGSRPLYIYVKKAHLDAIPGLRRFLTLYAANWGANGPLTRRGLIASPAAVQAQARAIITREIPLDPAHLPS